MSATRLGPTEALRLVEPFTRVDEATLRGLGDDLVWRSLAPGDVLVSAGTDAHELAVVIEGTLAVELAGPDGAPRRVAELGPGSIVGEIAVMFGGKRTASVTALTAAAVVEVTAAAFGTIVRSSPDIGGQLAERATQRLRQTQLADQLVRLFGDLGGTLLTAAVDAVDHVQLTAGETLFAGGDAADAAYIVLSGRLRSTGDDPARRVEFAPGDLVGEPALLDGDQRDVGVVAVRDTALGRLPREVFDRLVAEHPAAMLAITRRLIARTRRPARPGATDQLSVVVVPHTPDVDVRLFTSQLVQALGDGSLHLWSARIDSLLHQPGIAQSGRGGADDVRLSHWLHEAEQQHRYLVYEADATWTPWTERACRQADEVIIVARAATDDRSPGALEATLARTGTPDQTPRRTLVLLHDASVAQPSDTAAWLDARQVERHVHLRANSDRDLARLGRILTGTSTTLVLGGGGARGGAHLGVILALRGAGVPIDSYIGTSIGAVMAMVGALEWPSEEVVPRASRIFADLLDYTLPVVSLLKGELITKAIADAAGDLELEDLWRDLRCISTNLTRQEEVVHRRGRLSQAIRASVAIPGVLPPVPVGEDLLIDGGSMNNLPIDRARETNPHGTVIAVDVAPPRGPSAKDDFVPSISGWNQLAGRVLPGRRPVRVPGIVVTMLGATIVAAMRDRNDRVDAGLADLYLDLDLRGHGLLDFASISAIADAGHEAAKPRIDAWLADRKGGSGAAPDAA